MNSALVVQRLIESSDLQRHLAAEQSEKIAQVGCLIATTLAQGGKLLLFGNGGSAADAQHIAAELVGRFVRERAPLPAIALTTDTSAITAIGNDYGFDQIFSRQVMALGRRGDIAIAISTSGRSPNVLAGVETARKLGLATIGLTGGEGRPLADAVDVAIVVPSDDTARIQECHITVGHLLCEMVDNWRKEESVPQASFSGMSGAEPAVALRSPKVMAWDSLLPLREEWRGQGKCVVWTNGCFDLLHVGHIYSLRAARRFGDVLVVGINSDGSVRKFKGPGRPIVTATERAEVLAALEFVDAVVVFDELTPETALMRLKPDVHCKGAEYAPPHGKPIPELPLVTDYGGLVKFLPMVPFASTTDLIQRIRKIDEKTE